jgi:ornithine cyclodeaminase/alanine dehydrogenase-like protein (mu-crystallin family)
MDPTGSLVLSRSHVAAFLSMDACLGAVETAMTAHGSGAAPAPAVSGVHVADAVFHVKSGALALSRPYFASKTNANFPLNPARHGLPTVQGIILLFDAERGTPLAVMDATEITKLRTAAASALAAKHLALESAGSVAVIGCGVQGEAHLQALTRVRRIALARVYDVDPARAHDLATRLSPVLGFPIDPVRDVGAATAGAAIIVTCTTARAPVLQRHHVSPGAFVAAVGADNPEKHEVDPLLLRDATIVTDVTDQAATMGDLHHAIRAGAVTRNGVYAELGEVVAGRKPGRRSAGEIIVFDSTGMALQDVAAAAVVYECALAADIAPPRMRFDG